MKITAPVSKPYEVPLLARVGAGEFYCGVFDPEWVRKYDISVWMNRRNPVGANLRSLDELGLVVDKAASFGCPVFLTLNSHTYTPEQIHIALDLARQAARVGVHSFIVGDPGLMRTLQRHGFEGRIIVSTIGGVLNSQAVRFYRGLGARRIILPRDLALTEIARIAENFPEMEFETFIYNDRCPFLESNCHTLHGLPGKASFCFTNWQYDILARDPGAPPEASLWRAHLEHHREWLRASSNCGDTYTPTRVPNGTCGLCAIPTFLTSGVSSLKVVGREAPDYRKMLSVVAVQRVLSRALGGMDEVKVKREAVTLRGDDEICRSGYLCYYREANPFLAKRNAFRAKAGRRM